MILTELLFISELTIKMSSKDQQENGSSADTSQGKTVSRESSQGGKQPVKKTPHDFIFGKVIGEGSFSTVSGMNKFKMF